jgi:hypothetical protein
VALPPAPIGEPPGSFAWQQWYTALQQQFGGASGTISWELIDTSGSNLTDIATRAHNNLQTIQGGTTGSFFHLKTALKGSKTHDFGNVAAVNIATTTQAVTGATTTSVVVVTPTATLANGLTVYGYVSSADTVTLVCVNASAGVIAAGSKTYNILVMDN